MSVEKWSRKQRAAFDRTIRARVKRALALLKAVQKIERKTGLPLVDELIKGSKGKR